MSIIESILNKYMDETEKIHDDYSLSSIPSKPLYHYTNFEAFKSIVQNREIWFTEYHDLEDKSEINASIALVVEAVEAFTHTSRHKEFWINYNKKYPSHTDVNKVYTCSFCEVQDHIDAWNNYGDAGKGIAIGFHQNYFQQVKSSSSNKDEVLSMKICYDSNTFSSLIKSFLSKAEYALRKNINSKGISKKELKQIIAAGLTSNLIPLMPGYKESKFSSECEHRLYQNEFTINGKSYPCAIPNDRKSEDIHNSKVTHRLKWNNFHFKDICEIMIGPACKFGSPDNQVKNILLLSGYDTSKIKVTMSSHTVNK